MKIKTITCHNVYNHGASLQEYALIQYLKQEGNDVETINYQPYYLADNYRFLGVPSPSWKSNIFKRLIYILVKMPKHISNQKRFKYFDVFSEKFIPETKKVYRTNDELKKDLPEAEVYICGSDQIWNTLFQNGKDEAFYLDFAPKNKIKISYAASFATPKIIDGFEDFVKEKVANINHVSVREQSGVRILEDIGVLGATRVLDPVFLLDVDLWKSQFIEVREENYVLIYDFDSNDDIKDTAIRMAKENGWKIYALNKNINYADEIFWSIGPEKFLNLMYNANFILCNSFHALAFSLIFKKQFLVYNRNVGINTRMQDLLITLGLQNRLWNSAATKNSQIDYAEVEIKLKQMINVSKQFISKALNPS